MITLKRLQVDAGGNAYVVGDSSTSWGSPVRAFNGGTDAFVAKLSLNQTPIATANNYTTSEGVAVAGNVITDNTGAGVDSDPDGDPLTASLLVGPLHGTISLAANGAFTYTPYDTPMGPTLPRPTASPTRSATAKEARRRPSSASRSRRTPPMKPPSTPCPARRP